MIVRFGRWRDIMKAASKKKISSSKTSSSSCSRKKKSMERDQILSEHVPGYQGYVQYSPGSLPLILSVPHGGSLKPDSIPDRKAKCFSYCTSNGSSGEAGECKCCVTVLKDVYTAETAALLTARLEAQTGAKPHVILNRLHRRKLDANRPLEEATLHHPEAMRAYRDYHAFVQRARQETVEKHGFGLFLDIHGQSHADEWVELGYLIKGKTLDASCQSPEFSGLSPMTNQHGSISSVQLSDTLKSTQSSIRTLASRCTCSFEELIRGRRSLGGLLQGMGVKCVPSPAHPGPRGRPCYVGGHNTLTFGSKHGGNVDAIQIEIPKILRDEDNAGPFVDKLVTAVLQFLQYNYGYSPVD